MAPRSAGGCHSGAKQRGAALVVSLILLVVITLVGLAAIGTTIIQNKAAANQYDRQIAFQATEAAMRAAAVAITTNVSITATVPAPGGSTGIEDCSTPTGGTVPTNVCFSNPFQDASLPATAIQTDTTFTSKLAAAPPQYIIQYMGCFQGPQGSIVDISVPGSGSGITSDFYFYRITARSGDPTQVGSRSAVTLQSMFRNQACSP
jgi:type IV pilus assembly protein PilX